jgi:hypothetical protein
MAREIEFFIELLFGFLFDWEFSEGVGLWAFCSLKLLIEFFGYLEASKTRPS